MNVKDIVFCWNHDDMGGNYRRLQSQLGGQVSPLWPRNGRRAGYADLLKEITSGGGINVIVSGGSRPYVELGLTSAGIRAQIAAVATREDGVQKRKGKVFEPVAAALGISGGELVNRGIMLGNLDEKDQPLDHELVYVDVPDEGGQYDMWHARAIRYAIEALLARHSGSMPFNFDALAGTGSGAVVMNAPPKVLRFPEGVTATPEYLQVEWSPTAVVHPQTPADLRRRGDERFADVRVLTLQAPDALRTPSEPF